MLDLARKIADDVLFPAAMEVDAAERVPASHLDLLATNGFYGAADLPFAEFADVVTALASGCLTTTFVWLQHHSPMLTLAALDDAALRERWLPAFAAGRRRAGIGLAGIRNQANPLRVRATDGAYVLDGSVPWVTGWDMIDTIYLAAVDDCDVVHFLLVDAIAGPTLAVDFPALVAVQASRTGNVTFAGHRVAADRVVRTVPYADWSADDSRGSSLNGFLALGLVDRCIRLLGAGPTADALTGQLAAQRDELLSASASQLNVARAAASDLAWRAAGAVCVGAGARSVLRDQHGQRLAREATFLLVFGSRPAMRVALSERLTR